MEYKMFNGWKFPVYETRLLAVDESGESTYSGLKHIEIALEFVRNFGVMVDVGANVGLITVPMSKRFQKIYSFECVPETYECLSFNTKNLTNVQCFAAAVSDSVGKVNVAIPKSDGIVYSSGWASISKERQDIFPEKDIVEVKSLTIDSLNLDRLDFLKIDVEQAELMVIRGALNTIKKFKPVIEFENKRRENVSVIDLLTSVGYAIVPGRKAKSSECIMIAN
jgi:FkbM family methyltransferase